MEMNNITTLSDRNSTTEMFNELAKIKAVQKARQLLPKSNQATMPLATVQTENAPDFAAMPRHLAASDLSQSKYLKARLTAAETEEKLGNSQDSILTVAMAEYQSAKNAGDRAKALQRAKQRLQHEQTKEIKEHAEETHLQETRDRLDAAAEKTVIPEAAERADTNDQAASGTTIAPEEQAHTPVNLMV